MTKNPLPLNEAEAHARRLAMALYGGADAFKQVQIAGSIRRMKPLVGDIELVGEVDPEREFGATARITQVLHEIGVHRATPTIRTDGVEVKAPWGDRYMKGEWEAEAGRVVQIDLFIVRPPADWGVVFLIRTGSADFSHAVVTRLHRYGLRAQDAQIVDMAKSDGGKRGEHPRVPCPDEETFFKLAHLPWIPPEQRNMEDPATAALFQGE